MTRRKSPPKVIIIQRRQIIVNKRVRMHHFNRRGRNLGVVIDLAAKKFTTPQHQRRPHPLARRPKCVFERFFQFAVYLL